MIEFNQLFLYSDQKGRGKSISDLTYALMHEDAKALYSNFKTLIVGVNLSGTYTVKFNKKI